MTNEIKIKDTMTSLEIAEVTGKNHQHVMRDIRSLLDQGVDASNFGLTSYTDKANRQQPCFNLTKKGCLILASGYDALLREKIINRWEELELAQRVLVPQLPNFSDPAAAARAWAEQYEAKKALEIKNAEQQKQIEEAQPAVTFTNAFKGAETSCLVGELAKVLRQNNIEIGQNRLFKWLRDNHYLGVRGEQYNIPNQEWIERGYFAIKKGVRSGNDGVMHTTTTTKVTSKGQVYFINLFLNHGLRIAE